MMTQGKKWWFEKSASNTVYVLVDGKNGPEKLSHNQGRHRPYSDVKSSCVYEKDSKFLKSDNARAFNVENFLWNASDFSLQLKSFVKDVSELSRKLNSLLGTPPLHEVSVEVHHAAENSDPVTQSPVSIYEWDLSGSSVPVVQQSPAVRHRTAAIEDVPVLYKKKTNSMDAEAVIIEEVKKAFLGSAKVLNGNLHLGPLLRELNESFVQNLMQQMKAFPGHFYQPLCVIIEARDVLCFRESNANAFHYKVIGGCHNLTAAKRLEETVPDEHVFQSRMCCVYKDTLSSEAILWLANLHNKFGEYRHSMVLKDKIQLCRNLYLSAGSDEESSEKWKSTARLVIGDDHSKAVMKVIFKLATMESSTYTNLMTMLTMFGNGQLKNQKLKPSEIINGPTMKPFTLSDLPNLPVEAANILLQDLIGQVSTLSDFQKEARNLYKLQIIQKMFIDLTGSKTWGDACERFPAETKRSCLEQFLGNPLRSVPGELRSFCKSLLQEPVGHFRGLMHSSGTFISSTEMQIEEDNIKERVPQFSGVDLVLLDKPETWGESDIRMCLATVTGINLNHGHEEFSVAVLSPTGDMAMVAAAIRETRHFQAPMAAFYVVPSAVKSPTLTSIVVMTDQNFCARNFPPVDYYRHDDKVVDSQQKPLGIYTELVKALSSPGPVCSASRDVFCAAQGTGLVASLREGRNVIGFDVDEQLVAHIKMRVTKEVGVLQTQPRGEEEEVVRTEDSFEDGQESSEEVDEDEGA
ncbi:hypothetical protein HOLleu_43994 [Holothuria leucospilota]|uniref:Uncharacterized protein n=1 Tax=Holothuria leucospilota TaxID=206669 RepID=A0A9Q0YBC0_HOLLE|nr:hypothetical protein HOLleu_43994 [Holothuria leucospilota]